jgi:hypothetical protein
VGFGELGHGVEVAFLAEEEVAVLQQQLGVQLGRDLADAQLAQLQRLVELLLVEQIRHLLGHRQHLKQVDAAVVGQHDDEVTPGHGLSRALRGAGLVVVDEGRRGEPLGVLQRDDLAHRLRGGGGAVVGAAFHGSSVAPASASGGASAS